MNLQEKIFRALIDFEAQGEIYVEKEKVILGCMANGSEIEKGQKIFNIIRFTRKIS